MPEFVHGFIERVHGFCSSFMELIVPGSNLEVLTQLRVPSYLPNFARGSHFDHPLQRPWSGSCLYQGTLNMGRGGGQINTRFSCV